MDRCLQVSGLLSLAIVLAGCGGGGPAKVQVYPASGTVTVDGKPVDSARITLTPAVEGAKYPAAGGATGTDGSFKLKTYTDGDGVAEGSFNVGLASDPMKMKVVPTVKPLTVEIKRDSSGSIAPLKFDLEEVKGSKPAAGIPKI